MALDATKSAKTLAELAQQFDVHADQINTWKMQLTKATVGVFGSEPTSETVSPSVDLMVLHANIGELTLVNNPHSGFRGVTVGGHC